MLKTHLHGKYTGRDNQRVSRGKRHYGNKAHLGITRCEQKACRRAAVFSETMLARNLKTSITGARQSGIRWLSCLSKTKAKIKIFLKKDKKQVKICMCQLHFCCSGKTAQLKTTCRRKGLLGWLFQAEIRGKNSRELALLHIQREMSSWGNDAAHDRLGPPTSINNQDNLLQTHGPLWYCHHL